MKTIKVAWLEDCTWCGCTELNVTTESGDENKLDLNDAVTCPECGATGEIDCDDSCAFVSWNEPETEEYDHTKDLQAWFGLSRSSFLVMPRVAMQLMPEEWQEKMAQLLNQYDETINTAAFGIKGCRIQALNAAGKLMKMPEELLNYRHPQPETKAALLLEQATNDQ